MKVERKRYWLPTEPQATYVILAYENDNDRLVLESESKTIYDFDLSKKNFNKMIDKFGNDTNQWLTKEITILTEFNVVTNKNERTVI